MSRKVRRPSLDTLIRQVHEAGRSVERVVFAPDGGFELVLADSETMATAGGTANEIQRWFEKNAS